MAPHVHFNAEGVQAPDQTEMQNFWISGQSKGLIVKVATGDIAKGGWDQVLQVPPGESDTINRNLEESIIQMTIESPFVKAFFCGILEALQAGINKRIRPIQRVMQAMKDHQDAWAREGLSAIRAGLLDSDDAVIAGAIYYMSRKIPENSSSDQAPYGFKWHQYCDSFNDEVLYNILYRFLMFLHRMTMKSASGFSTVARTGPLAKERHWEASLGKRLLEAVFGTDELRTNADNTAQQSSREQRRTPYPPLGVHVYTIEDEDSHTDEDGTDSPHGVHVYTFGTDDSDSEGSSSTVSHDANDNMNFEDEINSAS